MKLLQQELEDAHKKMVTLYQWLMSIVRWLLGSGG